MDHLFNAKSKFWIEDIVHVGSEESRARIIPVSRSEYYPPQHMRRIVFPTHQLEPEFYRSRQRLPELDLPEERSGFKGGLVQGGYYDLSRTRGEPKRTDSGEYDLASIDLDETRTASPVDDQIRADLQSPQVLSADMKRGFDSCRLYCFNVGQGDSSLLILNGSAYLIDTNIYSWRSLERFSIELKSILKMERIGNRIKALVITHKHVDHLRGVHRLMEEGLFTFEHFIINSMYTHATGAVEDLLSAAEKHIPRTGWIESSRPFVVNEGGFRIEVLNPTSATNTKAGAPDINDSSIVFTVQRADEGLQLVLTGDASYPVLVKALVNHSSSRSVLSVSHHGSRTGTSARLRSMLNPIQAHISAGNSRSYGHPHEETLNILNTPPAVRPKISKRIGKTVRFNYDSDLQRACLLVLRKRKCDAVDRQK